MQVMPVNIPLLRPQIEPLLAAALAKAPVLFSVTLVQVWACRPMPKNRAANASRKLITNDEPRN